MSSLPIIDLQPLWDSPEGINHVAEQLTLNFKDLGFAYIKNHQISPSLLEDMFQAAKDFHALPLEAKNKILQNKTFRGYLPANTSQVKVSTQGVAACPNSMEAFIMMFDVDETHRDYTTGNYLAGPNQWPVEMPSLKKNMCDYRDAMIHLGSKMVEVFAVAFGLEATALNQFFVDPTFFLRLHRYAPQPDNAPKGQFGIAPHTDIGFMTFVAQDDVGGLEVKHPTEGWITVPNIPGTFILNAGDMLKRWTNGGFASVPHRVLNNSDQVRYSIPFFFDPNMHAMIDVLESPLSDSPRKFEPIMYGDYVMNRVTPNYSHLQTKP